MRSRILTFLFAFVAVYSVFNRDDYHRNLFNSDKCGYYLYLPAAFIYHDVRDLKFYDQRELDYGQSFFLKYSIHDVNGHKLNKYAIGTALFEAPLFFVAHAYCLATGQFRADGFSQPYQLAGIFSAILWSFIALLILRRLLLRYFTDPVTAITLCCIAFGTNLYTYAVFDGGMSHNYSFFLFCCLVSLTDKWYSEPPKKLTSMGIGVVAGLIFIVRPINVVALIIPVLWQVYDIPSLRARANYLVKNAGHLGIVAVFAFLTAFVQFYYWHYVTGQWIYYSYTGEHLDFLHPHVINGLFSIEKGWFVYTPIALLGMVGFIYLWRQHRKIVPALLIFFIVMIYAVFSWEQWWYGCGFGARPMIEALAFVAFPMAALTTRIWSLAAAYKKILYATLLACFIALNMFQSYQYSKWLLDCEYTMTVKKYIFLFGKTSIKDGEYEQYKKEHP